MNPQEAICKEKQMGFLTSKSNIPILSESSVSSVNTADGKTGGTRFPLLDYQAPTILAFLSVP